MTSVHRNRPGFTLIELLIVVSIIAVLAGLLLPAIGLVKQKIKTVQCSNNLRQLGTAIEAYRMEHEDQFPVSLRSLFDSTQGGVLDPSEVRILICPNDLTRGQGKLNRDLWTPHLDELWEPEKPCSYTNEVSGVPITQDMINGKWFSATATDVTDLPKAPPAFLFASWWQAKTLQRSTGYPSTTMKSWGFSVFPMIRCYWHEKWTPANASSSRRVNNLFWGFNIGSNLTYWEHDVDPAIPLPAP